MPRTESISPRSVPAHTALERNAGLADVAVSLGVAPQHHHVRHLADLDRPGLLASVEQLERT